MTIFSYKILDHMANLTFSKNGIPMGRGKSSADNKHARWSTAEDNYIKMAVETGVPASTVASKLGRSIASIQNRKWSLGIEERFANSPRGSSKAAVAKPAKAAVAKSTNTGVQLFTLESGIPIPTKGQKANEEARTQLRGLFNKMSTGQSFVVPKNIVHVAAHLVKKEFGAFKIRTSATTPEKKFFRIFRVA